MLITPVNTNKNNPCFGAYLSNMKINDRAADSVNTLVNSFKQIAEHLPDTKIKYANTTASSSPYMAGYRIEMGENKDLGIIFDDNNNVYYIFLNQKVPISRNRNLIKSFYYYKGNRTAYDPIPRISYSECDEAIGINNNGYKSFDYREGESIPDNIALKIKLLTDRFIKALDLK